AGLSAPAGADAQPPVRPLGRPPDAGALQRRMHLPRLELPFRRLLSRLAVSHEAGGGAALRLAGVADAARGPGRIPGLPRALLAGQPALSRGRGGLCLGVYAVGAPPRV